MSYSVEIRNDVLDPSNNLVPHTFLVVTGPDNIQHFYGFAPATSLSPAGPGIIDQNPHSWNTTSGSIDLTATQYNLLMNFINASIANPPYYDVTFGNQCSVWAMEALFIADGATLNSPLSPSMLSSGPLTDLLKSIIWNPAMVAPAFFVAHQLDNLNVLWSSLQQKFYGLMASAGNNSFWDNQFSAPKTGSPIILDLTGDGVSTVSENAGTYFDLRNTGFAEKTGWIAPTDGLLVWDRNGNGTIDSGSELFGNYTPMANGATATNGFAALASYDSNGDGKITSADAIWSNLKIWVDANGNGVTDAGELHSLSSLGIQSLNLSYTNKGDGVRDAASNNPQYASSYTLTNGTTRAMDDVNFANDTSQTVTNSWVATTSAIDALPDLQEQGTLYSLHQAMARDTMGTLQSLVTQFVNATDTATRNSVMEQILIDWAGAQNVNPTSRNSNGGNFNAQHLAVLEAVEGRPFLQAGYATNPGDPVPLAATQLGNAYFFLSERMYAELAAQTFLQPFYNEIATTTDSSGTHFDFTAVLADLFGTGRSAALQQTDILEFYRTVFASGLLDAQVNYAGLLSALAANQPGLVSAVNTLVAPYYAYGLVSTINNLPGWYDLHPSGDNSTIVGGLGGNTIDANASNGGGITYYNITVYANAGTNVINAAPLGVDQIYGGTGDDTVNDYGTLAAGTVIDGGAGNNTLSLYTGVGADITQATISNFQTLVLNTYNTTMTAAQFSSFANMIGVSGSNGGEIDVTTAGIYDLHTINITGHVNLSARGTSANITLIGNDVNNQVLAGGPGTDTLTAGNGSGDILQAGIGNTTMNAGTGNETLNGSIGYNAYRFGTVFGQDFIQQAGLSAAKGEIDFTSPTVTYENLWFTQSGNNLVVRLLGTNDTITVSNWFGGGGAQVQTFNAANGLLNLSNSAVAQLVSAMATYQAAHSSFNPMTATQMPTDSTLQSAITTAWHGTVNITSVTVATAMANQSTLDNTAGGYKVVDTAANVAAGLAFLASDASHIVSITLTDSTTPTLALTATQYSADTAALGKISSAYNLSITGVSAANASTVAGQVHVTSMAVSDTGANVVTNIAALETLATDAQLSSITLTDSTTPTLALTSAQYSADSAVLGKTGNSYNLSIFGVTAANAATVAGAAHVTSITVSDTSANIVTNIAALETLTTGTKLSSITLTDGTTPTFSLTPVQLSNDSAVLQEITSYYKLAVSGGFVALGNNQHVDITGSNNTVIPGLNDNFGVAGTNTSIMVDSNDGIFLTSPNGIADPLAALGSNAVVGNGGGQTLSGGSGITVMVGDGGNNTFVAPGAVTGGTVTVWGGTTSAPSGSNTVDYSSYSGNLEIVLGQGEGPGGATGWVANSDTYQYLASLNDIDNVIGGSGNNSITGNSNNDVISGGNGNDWLTGGSGNDTFIVGTGNNTINGGGGNNTYQFGSSFAQDTINNNSGTTARGAIDFASGITDEKLWFQQSGSDLLVDLLGTNGQIDIAGWFNGNAGTQVQSFNAGGLKLDTQVPQLVAAMATYGAAHSGFNPATATEMPADSVLQAAITTAWAVSVATAMANRFVLDGIAGGYTVADTAANVLGNVSFLTSDVSHIASITLTDSGTPTISLTPAQLSNDSAVLQEITSTYNLAVSGGFVVLGSNQHVDIVGSNNTVIPGSNDNFGVAGTNTSIMVNGEDGIFLTSSNGIADPLAALGSNAVVGTAGNDTISGGSGINVMVGNGGNNTFIAPGAATGGTVTVWGGTTSAPSGSNTVDYSSYSGNLEIVLGQGEGPGGATGWVANSDTYQYLASLNGIDNVIGGSGNNFITGNSDNDVISGGNGNNWLTGGSGNDTFIVGTGNNTINGGGGNNTYQFGSSFGQDVINNNSGMTAQGEIDFASGITDEKLWFQQSGSDLLIQLLGTNDQIDVSGWFNGIAGYQVQAIHVGNLTLDTQVAQLVLAMASYAAANPAFNPTTATSMPTDSALQTEIATAWHATTTTTPITAQNGTTIASYNGASSLVDVTNLPYDSSITAAFVQNSGGFAAQILVSDHGSVVDTINLQSVQNLGSLTVHPDGSGGTLLIDPPLSSPAQDSVHQTFVDALPQLMGRTAGDTSVSHDPGQQFNFASLPSTPPVSETLDHHLQVFSGYATALAGDVSAHQAPEFGLPVEPDFQHLVAAHLASPDHGWHL
ncbi:beta strand repeat-containing protein [Bradyrhizobium sp.]